MTWWPGDAETPVEFAHPLFRAAVYDDLSPGRRQELHRAAAACAGTAAAWTHRVAAADGADDALADELSQAALRERAQPGADGLATAARYLLWASSLSSARDQAERRLLEAIRLLLAEGQSARAVALRARAEACSNGPLRNLVLGTLAWAAGDAGAAERWLRTVPELVGDDVPGNELRAAALAQLGVLYSYQGRAAAALDAGTRTLSRAPTDARAEHAAWAAVAIGEARLRGAPAGAARLAERLPQPPDLVPATDANLLVVRGMLAFYSGRVAAATADLRAVTRLARRGYAVTELPRAHVHLAQLLMSSGDWDEALVHARTALSLVCDERLVWLQAQAHAAAGSVLASRGDWDAAGEHVTAAEEAAAPVGTAEASYVVRIVQATVARARHEPEQVVATLSLLYDGSGGQQIPMISSLGWWPVLIAAITDCGDIDTADRQLSRLQRAADARGLDLRARITGLRARVAQARGLPDEALAGFRQAIALMGANAPLLDRALLHQSFGRLLLTRGHRRAAVDQFRAAHDLLAGVGAEPYLRRVEADMRACGLRPASAAARSPLALTGREHDVAALAAKGMTNREIAAELYISEKAVEYHLGNVFGKLGITSRRQLRNRRLD